MRLMKAFTWSEVMESLTAFKPTLVGAFVAGRTGPPGSYKPEISGKTAAKRASRDWLYARQPIPTRRNVMEFVQLCRSTPAGRPDGSTPAR